MPTVQTSGPTLTCTRLAPGVTRLLVGRRAKSHETHLQSDRTPVRQKNVANKCRERGSMTTRVSTEDSAGAADAWMRAVVVLSDDLPRRHRDTLHVLCTHG